MRRLVPLLFLAVLALSLAPASAYEPLAVVIEGPATVAPGTSNNYTITVTGGPGAGGGSFEIAYVLQGDNLAGGDPQLERTSANQDGKFTVNMTAPDAEGRIALFVRATSFIGEVSDVSERRFLIDVYRPIELRATIRNQGAAAVTDVTIFFLVDGKDVGNQTVARIEAGGQADVSLTYIPAGLSVGRHTVQVKADLDGDGRFTPERGELLESQFFYKSQPSNMPAILGTITVLILIVLAFLLLAIRRQRRLG